MVIDAGSKQERTVVLLNHGDLFTGDGNVWPFAPIPGSIVVHPMTLGPANPLPVGAHVDDVYWVFSDTHCDGIGDDIDFNCLSGEDLYVADLEFEVTPGHH